MDALLALIDQNEIFNLTTLEHYWDGFVMTTQLVFLSLIIGLLVSVPLAIMRTSKNPLINYPVWVFTYVFRGTPLLIQLYLIYYGVTLIEGIQDSVFWVIFERAYYPCLIAFALNTAAYTTEIFRGAIETTSKGEIEAARAYGMSWSKCMKRIVLPSAFRRAIPAYTNEVIFMLHASAIASTVTIIDLTGAARDIYARFYAPFEAFLFVAAIYLCLTFSIIMLFKQLEKRLLGHLQPR
ncbi:ABC transporter permease [Bermanella marisrubri]|uniref:Arginine ABC transporter permease protein ArtM n=1 Tax=Bermanella marisrubri TaxID=207949 RepID=Q1N3E0_9GAMM|nr:ABC transporter permease [Bermanella marisrubri]EAT12651.1 ABC-type arginine/histidine transport system, permease component [Oceanobacter sp. RED65] [Bermanella marisrubri]QIZ85224.1 ABC transporter permease [Bermanella marisrubri]